MNKEAQRRIRSEYHVNLTVCEENQQMCISQCESQNISVNGILLQSNKDLPVGTKCTVELVLPGSDVKLNIDGVVARQSVSGFAIEFEAMDEVTLEHLKKIVLYNSDKPDEVYDQFKKDGGFK